MKVSTYSRNTQEDLSLDASSWSELQQYLADIGDALGSVSDDFPQVQEVEEGPPHVNSKEQFCPGGWAGSYPGDVVVVPGKISEDEYSTMLGDLQGWVEMMGANLVRSSLPLSAKFLVDSDVRLSPYSEALIEYTEGLLSNRLPVEVSTTTQRGRNPGGRPDFEKTAQLQFQGSRKIVSRKVEFSFDSLQNHLLIRFHAELNAAMQSLADEYEYYDEAFQHQINYHQNFITSGIADQLVDQSLQIDFSNPEVLSRLRREVTGEMAEVVDLWEAYRRDLAFETELADRLNTAVKPVSKVYELWCLGAILDSLSVLIGRDPDHSQLRNSFDFGDGLTLYYNRRLTKHSRYLSPMFSVGAGEPDFAIEKDGRIVWIGDAKFKTFGSMNIHDYRRFIVYLIDFLAGDEQSEGAIMYIDETPATRRHTVADHTVSHVPLRPDRPDKLLSYFEDLEVLDGG